MSLQPARLLSALSLLVLFASACGEPLPDSPCEHENQSQCDAGTARPDAGSPDSGSGTKDGGGLDAGADAGPLDSGTVDAGPDLTVPLTEVLATEAAAQDLVGVAAGVSWKGRTYVIGTGHADRESDELVNPEQTLFRWASMSKSVTAIIALRLHAAGKLNLDAQVSTLIPGYVPPSTYVEPCTTGSTTVRDSVTYSCTGGFFEFPLGSGSPKPTSRLLMGHLAGIAHYTNGKGTPYPPNSAINDPVTNTGIEWALSYLTNKPLVAVPGATYSYSTFGFNLLGVALEHAAEEPFATQVETHVAGPAGLSSLTPDYEWVAIPNRSAGYRKDGSGNVVRDGSNDVSWKLPGGGLQSTVRDLLGFCEALRGDSLLTSELKQLAWTAQTTSTGAKTNYGLGFSVGSRSGRKLIAHTGEQEKSATQFRLYPDDGLCVVVMTNSRWADTSVLVRALEDVMRAP